MLNSELGDAASVIQALRDISNEIRGLMDAIGNRSTIPQDEVKDLQTKLKNLKDRLRICQQIT